jgi:hypothetical protein
MRSIWRARGGALLIAACLALLAACGSSTLGGTTQPTPSSSLNGCPSRLIPVDPPRRPADVVLTQQNDPGSNFRTVTVSVGQSIEIRLPASFDWRLARGEPDPAVLALANPAGWYNSSLRACIWRLSAAAPGTAELEFAGGFVCEPGVACPALAAVARYKITVA